MLAGGDGGEEGIRSTSALSKEEEGKGVRGQ